MPSIAAHMVVAKQVGQILKIEDPEFIKGNLLPDIIKNKNSHHKIKGNHFSIPDLNYFKTNLDLYNPLYLGYYTHLLLDYYFLEQFIPKNISNLDVFHTKIIYNEYDNLNYQLIQKFHLNINYLKTTLKKFKVKIDKKKLNYNLDCLSITKLEETTYLKFEDFSKFLSEISYVISKEIKKYASKPN